MWKYILVILALSSCTIKNEELSAHGQESDYYYELEMDKMYPFNCNNCDEID